MMTLPSTRRRFLASSLAGGAGLMTLPSATTALSYQANERLRLAVFGNMYNAAHFLNAAHVHDAEIVAVCNPDQRKLDAVFERWQELAKTMLEQDQTQRREVTQHYQRLAQRQGVAVYQDFRRMFDEMENRIDAVVVSDVDHFHGVLCGAAMRLGKPVCSERPLGLTIQDARALRALADQTKVATTYRSPGTGSGQFRRAMELVEQGEIGEVKEVHIWFKRGGPDRNELPQGPEDVPEGLDWDLWLAPLPWREYHPDWMIYAHWRETSNGGLGVFGPHTSIFPFMTLQLRQLYSGMPGETEIRVSAECSSLNPISYPRWERVRWEIPARGEMPPVTITWHHGPEYPPGSREVILEALRGFGVTSEQEADDLMRTAGSLLVGTDGAMVADDHSVRVTALPREKFAEIETDRPLHLPASQGIYVDWIDAVRGGDPHIIANFDNGGPLSELLMLGNIATQFPGQTIRYDPAAGTIADHPKASERLGYEYRDPWRI